MSAWSLFRLERSAFRLCVFTTTATNPLPIVMKVGINALGTEVEQRVCKDF